MFTPLHIPKSLRELDRWVVWRRETRVDRVVKVPVSAVSGARADVTDFACVCPLEQAQTFASKRRDIAGLGFAFFKTDGVVGIDIDGCVEDGALTANAAAIVAAANTYTEFSPSGTGVKLFGFGTKPVGSRCRGKLPGTRGIEIYDRDRFFTVTGQHVPGTPACVNDCGSFVGALLRRLAPTPAPSFAAVFGANAAAIVDDDRLVERAKAAANGAKFNRLWQGDTSAHGGDHSDADLALCSLLAFWTRGDADRIDRLFRRSGLFRDKWDSARRGSTYGRITIQRAIGKSALVTCTDVTKEAPHEPR
jgi:putative DNA primase/helicase